MTKASEDGKRGGMHLHSASFHDILGIAEHDILPFGNMIFALCASDILGFAEHDMLPSATLITLRSRNSSRKRFHPSTARISSVADGFHFVLLARKGNHSFGRARQVSPKMQARDAAGLAKDASPGRGRSRREAPFATRRCIHILREGANGGRKNPR